MTENPTVAELLRAGTQRLAASFAGAAPEATPALDVEVLIAHVLEVPRARLRSHPETRADAGHLRKYLGLLERRAAGEPLAYLTGWREFWSLPLKVSAAVLVPRPESELLVERALALRPGAQGSAADLGTGSGAVALAIASERPRWRVVATDLSAEALAVARANAAALGLGRIEFRQGDWFAPLARERFDLLVSNPPYVAAADPALSCAPLAHEPRLALSPGEDALASLLAIARGAPGYLAREGWLLLEHGIMQAASVRNALVATGFRYVRSHRDLAGHERMTEGQLG